MNRKSIAQEYYILVTDKYGMLPAMNREEAGAGLAAAAFMELLAAGVIEEEKKKTVVVKDLPAELEYLRPLYIYLREKHRYANRIMTDWHSGSRCRQLMELIGRSLQEAGLDVKPCAVETGRSEPGERPAGREVLRGKPFPGQFVDEVQRVFQLFGRKAGRKGLFPFDRGSSRYHGPGRFPFPGGEEAAPAFEQRGFFPGRIAYQGVLSVAESVFLDRAFERQVAG